MKFVKKLGGLVIAAAISTSASAGTSCHELGKLVGGWHGFKASVEAGYDATLATGFGLGMWATLMDTSGKVCAVYSVDGETAAPNGGAAAGNTAWLGSRIISAQKANTANAFSLDELSIPTGAISVAVYPGGSLYGLQHSNPVDASRVYKGSPYRYGTKHDPLVGKRPGGVNVFGGGIALYDSYGTKVGALGVSGDTSCRDAAMAFNIRKDMGLDNAPNFPEVLTLVAEPSDLFQQPACGVADPNDADNFGVVVAD
jgi:uncharacterized protein GlcG (DUF336 family)